jgi:predicted dehydrogenase
MILPIAYRERLKARLDINHLLSRVEWVKDEEELFELVDKLVIARSPEYQSITINKSLSRNNIRHLFLEKPLAHNPEASSRILSAITSAGKKLTISYSLLYTKWFNKLVLNKNNLSVMQLEWSFMAHHFQNNLFNWKRFHSQGGGVLRFYGIHIIAMLALLGYTDVIFSSCIGNQPDEPQSWNAIFTGSNLSECQVFINSFSTKSCFTMSGHKGKFIVNLNDPFDIPSSSNFGSEDRRVNILTNMIREQEAQNVNLAKFYQDVNSLWYNIEKITSWTMV